MEFRGHPRRELGEAVSHRIGAARGACHRVQGALPFDIEVRAEGDGPPVVSGTVIRYGESSQVTPTIKERFRPGAFGPDVGRLDVILNVMHDRARPLARSNGGGLVLTDSPEALRAVQRSWTWKQAPGAMRPDCWPGESCGDSRSSSMCRPRATQGESAR